MFNEEEFLRIANRPSGEFSVNELKIKDSDKKRIIEYINQNELDYKISDGAIFKFHLISDDGYMFHVHNYNDQYIVTRSDNSRKFEYFYYKNLQQVIEQLAFHDNSIKKTWWGPIMSTVDIGFNKENYSEDWFKDIITNKNWTHLEWGDQYKYAVYSEKINIKVISPYSKLHEVSLFNTYSPVDMDKLYFEIHPIRLTEGSELYMVKILINNEEIMKEYINYRIRRKKGLKLFLKDIFTNNNKYVQIVGYVCA